ncbi:MAG TPA: hypothetical protein VEG84_00020 [Thermoanaerobaculia bacterium]|nr:hypothetical protein [Thermoanaerobaculia bacterium]
MPRPKTLAVSGGSWLLLLALAAAPAAAQTVEGRAGPWTVTAFAGWYSGATPYTLTGPVSGDVKLASAAEYGVRVGYDVSRRVGVEVAWTGTQPRLVFANSALGSIGERHLNTVELAANISLFQAGPTRLLFVGSIGGAGMPASQGGTNLTMSPGLAYEIFVTRHVSLRLAGAFRETYGNIGPGDKDAFCDATGCYAYRTDFYSNWEASGGLKYAF